MRHRRLIIKADDFARGPLLHGWRRFFDVCLNAGATPSVGAVAGDFVRNPPAQHLARYLRDISRVEFWNHSLNHKDVTRQSSAERIQETTESQKIFADVLGEPASVYGAPFNKVNGEALRDVQEAGQFSCIYFADAGGPDPGVAPTIPIALSAPLELSTTALHQISPDRLFTFLGHAGDPEAIVLQLHPAYWSDECFVRFKSTLNTLLKRGYQVLTAREYMSSLGVSSEAPAARLDAGSMIAAAELIHADAEKDERMLGGDQRAQRAYYAGRLRRNLVGISRFLHENGLGERADHRDVCRVLDVGAGMGNWTMASAAARPNIEAVALDRDASLLEFMREGLQRYVQDPRCSFAVGNAEDLKFPDDSFDYAICSNAINYMQVERATAELARVLRGGTALIGVQNDLYPLLDALRSLAEGAYATALERLDRFFGNLARRHGGGGPKPFISYWTDHEFMTVAAYAGFYPLRKGVTLPEEYGALFGVQTLWGYLLRTNPQSKERATALRQGKGVTAADVDVLICVGAYDLALSLMASASDARRASRLGALLQRMAAADQASLDVVLTRFEQAGLPVDPEAVRDARAVHAMSDAKDWAGLSRHYRSSGEDIAALCAAWFAFRAGDAADAAVPPGAGPGEAALFELGRAASARDKQGISAGVAAFFDAYADQGRVMQLLLGGGETDAARRDEGGAYEDFQAEKARWLAAVA